MAGTICPMTQGDCDERCIFRRGDQCRIVVALDKIDYDHNELGNIASTVDSIKSDMS